MISLSVSQESEVSERWSTAFGKIKKEQVIYTCQILIVFTVIIACLVNLTISDTHPSLWASILSGSVGYILPAPKIRKNKKKQNVTLLSDTAQQQFV